MVSSIVPGAASAHTLGAELRSARSAQAQAPRRDELAQGDRVEISGASLAAARESVRAGVVQVQRALAVGHDAQAMLVKIQALAGDGGADAQVQLDAMLAAFGRRVEAAVAQGARVLTGEDVLVQAEPGAAPVTIPGVDLRLKDWPDSNDVIGVSFGADVDDPALPQAAQRSLEALQAAMGRLMESVRALEAHQGFLSAAQSAAAGVRPDLDADGARLMALQVRQGLEAAGAAPIANVAPQAVLALFRT